MREQQEQRAQARSTASSRMMTRSRSSGRGDLGRPSAGPDARARPPRRRRSAGQRHARPRACSRAAVRRASASSGRRSRARAGRTPAGSSPRRDPTWPVRRRYCLVAHDGDPAPPLPEPAGPAARVQGGQILAARLPIRAPDADQERGPRRPCAGAAVDAAQAPAGCATPTSRRCPSAEVAPHAARRRHGYPASSASGPGEFPSPRGRRPPAIAGGPDVMAVRRGQRAQPTRCAILVRRRWRAVGRRRHAGRLGARQRPRSLRRRRRRRRRRLRVQRPGASAGHPARRGHDLDDHQRPLPSRCSRHRWPPRAASTLSRRALVTEQCLLNPNRNPGMDRARSRGPASTRDRDRSWLPYGHSCTGARGHRTTCRRLAQ